MTNRLTQIHTRNVEALEQQASRLMAWLSNPFLPDHQQEYITDRYFTLRDEIDQIKTLS